MTRRTVNAALLLALFILVGAATAQAGEPAAGTILPRPSCTPGWNIDGDVSFFTSDNLFDRINGEAELYFPYGFNRLAYGRYANTDRPQVAIDADVYAMGSLLDAFGIYASYRRKDDAAAAVGAEGTVSSSQLFFYQGSYFVRLQVTGDVALDPAVFLACARTIAAGIPAAPEKPAELAFFDLPAIEKKSARYIARSLLGYDFFPRGVIADAAVGGATALVFVVPAASTGAAAAMLDAYAAYLEGAGKKVVRATAGGASLLSIDPLYGNVYVEQSGPSLTGVVKFGDAAAARTLVSELRKKQQGK